jgi:cystine transport system permease protein
MQESIQLVIDSLPYLLKGAVFTLQLSIGGMFFGLVLGFILALMRLSPVLPVRWLARFYISVFRGTPLIAQLFMIYYGLPQFGIELDPIPAAMIGLSLNTAAYTSETLRAAISSIDKGQCGGQYRDDALADAAPGHPAAGGAWRFRRSATALSAW